MYSIKAITTLTGLTAETLRAWERRYAGITPARSDSGRRLYSQQELEKLTLLAELTRNGHTISKIAGLSCEALRELQRQSQAAGGDLTQPLLEQIIEALMAYRIDRCEQLLKRALLAKEPIDYVSDILLPALNKIGDLWHQEKLNIAQEHMFSCCVKRIVLSMVNNLHTASLNSPAMLFATPTDETHEFGILLSCLLAAAQQYRCYYLGADLPGKDIVEAIHHLKPDVVVIGLVKTPPEPASVQQLQVIVNAKETAGSTIWLGGEGAQHGYPSTTSANCELIADIHHFYSKAQQRLLLDRT